ncbi:helix-turn-helix domain-containing protein [Microbacterium sp. VKM Ac-2923]|uniref:helix-turn-helix domain-containing protein n=1 Tax=Microbacterium sp. VKM Ac-2923 TaxID=2929476 RepID=UPI0035AB884D
MCNESVLEKALEQIKISYSDCQFSADCLARELAISRRHLAREFKSKTGSGVAATIARTRVEIAMRLLASDDSSCIATVASAVGYADINTFRNNFKRVAGVAPSAYRRSRRRKASAS